MHRVFKSELLATFNVGTQCESDIEFGKRLGGVAVRPVTNMLP